MKYSSLSYSFVWSVRFFCVLFIVTSCKPTVPSDYIQPGDMEDILYDYHISQAMGDRALSNDISLVEARNLYYHAVLRKHNITEAEFDSSLVYYYSHADKLHDIYKKVSERMEKNAINLGASTGEIAKYSQFNADGDTANIWRGEIATVLIPSSPYNRMDFVIEADSTFKRGDSFLFNFLTDFIYQSGTKDAIACLSVCYDNDSVATHYTHISTSGFSQLRVPANMKNNIKELKGFVYLNRGSDQSVTQKKMFIKNIQLIRLHSAIREEEIKEENHKVDHTDADVTNDSSGIRKMVSNTEKRIMRPQPVTDRKKLSISSVQQNAKSNKTNSRE